MKYLIIAILIASNCYSAIKLINYKYAYIGLLFYYSKNVKEPTKEELEQMKKEAIENCFLK